MTTETDHWFWCWTNLKRDVEARVSEARRLGFASGYAAAVDDLGLHDKFTCPQREERPPQPAPQRADQRGQR